MNGKDAYKSTIPVEAIARPKGKHTNGKPTQIEYYLGEDRVGLRLYSYNGDPEQEYSLRNGAKHGWEYRFDTPGKLLSATPYENGAEHGTAYQWADNRTLIGTYTMDHGTGTDLCSSPKPILESQSLER